MNATLTRAQLAAILRDLRLSARDRERLRDDLALLANVTGGGDDREIVLGPRTSDALARVRAADREISGTPRGLA